MAGELVPLILFARYSSFVGAGDYTTLGMDVTAYASALVNMWRRAILGTGATSCLLTFEESTDQGSWSNCSVTTGSNPVTLQAETERLSVVTLNKRWFRAKVTLNGTGPSVTCWAVGSLEQRTD
jgi:hypothetical protein